MVHFLFLAALTVLVVVVGVGATPSPPVVLPLHKRVSHVSCALAVFLIGLWMSTVQCNAVSRCAVLGWAAYVGCARTATCWFERRPPSLSLCVRRPCHGALGRLIEAFVVRPNPAPIKLHRSGGRSTSWRTSTRPCSWERHHNVRPSSRTRAALDLRFLVSRVPPAAVTT